MLLFSSLRKTSRNLKGNDWIKLSFWGCSQIRVDFQSDSRFTLIDSRSKQVDGCEEVKSFFDSAQVRILTKNHPNFEICFFSSNSRQSKLRFTIFELLLTPQIKRHHNDIHGLSLPGTERKKWRFCMNSKNFSKKSFSNWCH